MANERTAHLRLVSGIVDGIQTDFAFHFFPENDTMQHIRVHKQLLSLMCPKFKELFDGAWKDLMKVEVDDSTYKAFNAFVEYFYKGAANITDDNVADLITLAKKYKVDEVVAECTAHMAKSLTVENAVALYSESIGNESLRGDLERFISDNYRDVLKTSGLLRCRFDVLTAILNLEQFQCAQITMFDACTEWAKKQCEIKQIDPSDGKRFRKELAGCFDHIRFDEIDYYQLYLRSRKFDGKLFSKKQLLKLFVEDPYIGEDNIDDTPNATKKNGGKAYFPFNDFGPVRIADETKHLIRFSISKTMKLIEVSISNVIVDIQKDETISSTIKLTLNKNGQTVYAAKPCTSDDTYVEIELNNGPSILENEIYELEVSIKPSKTTDKRRFVRVHQLVNKQCNGVDLRIYEAGARIEHRIIGSLLFDNEVNGRKRSLNSSKRSTPSSKRQSIVPLKLEHFN